MGAEADCKSAVLALAWFDSKLSHQLTIKNQGVV